MQLYKKRSFGELISDTLNFFKEYGKNYFKNYFVINGLPFLVLILVIVVGFKDIISQFFNSNMGGQSFYFEQYFEDNLGVFLFICFLIIVLFTVISVISYSFPVVYMDKLAKEGKKDFTAGEILSAIKNRAGKMLIYMLLGLLIIFPIMGIIIFLNVLLAFLIVGIPLFFITLPCLMNIINFTLFDYLTTNNSYFTSLGNGIKIQFTKSTFWKYLGASIIVYLIINFTTSIFTTIPGFLFGFLTATVDQTQQDISTGMSYFIILLYTISIIVSLILSNALYVCTGLMYYDSRDDLQREVLYDEIDSIGQNV